MKIYTRTGDKGRTSLLGGQKVDKDHIRIEAYGTVDELNSFIGLLISQLEDSSELKKLLTRTQRNLFSIGSRLACLPESSFQPDLFEESEVTELEETMDNYDRELEPLKNFILPGGHKLASLAHVCRVVCRRAERRVVSLSNSGVEVDELIIRFLNRLSDYLFVLSRKLNHDQQIPDNLWVSS